MGPTHHQHSGHQHAGHGHAGHGHQAPGHSGHGHGHEGADPGSAYMAEMLELDAEVLRDYMSELTGWLGELSDREPQRIVDLGAGTGTGAFALARQFPQADVIALDNSPQLLQMLSTRAADLGLDTQVTGVLTNLDEPWTGTAECDLIWAASSLHHMADPDRVLADAFAALRPGGLLAVTEMNFFPRVLPQDIGIGRPGLEDRVHEALNTSPFVDWTEHLARAGFTVEERRVFAIELPSPPAGVSPTSRLAQLCLQRLRSALDGQVPAEDVATLDALLDEDGPHSVLRRDDLAVRSTRTTWAARRP